MPFDALAYVVVLPGLVGVGGKVTRQKVKVERRSTTETRLACLQGQHARGNPGYGPRRHAHRRGPPPVSPFRFFFACLPSGLYSGPSQFSRNRKILSVKRPSWRRSLVQRWLSAPPHSKVQRGLQQAAVNGIALHPDRAAAHRKWLWGWSSRSHSVLRLDPSC